MSTMLSFQAFLLRSLNDRMLPAPASGCAPSIACRCGVGKLDRVGARGSGLGTPGFEILSFLSPGSVVPPLQLPIPEPDPDPVGASFEPGASPLRPPDPVPLHRQHFVRPAWRPVGGLQPGRRAFIMIEEAAAELAGRDGVPQRQRPPSNDLLGRAPLLQLRRQFDV